MNYAGTKITDVKILEPEVFGDDRGFFMEVFRASEFAEYCSKREFVQENHSKSRQGILRGLHYQLQRTQGKLVRVVSGSVYDVVVDLRQSSPTFGEWLGMELSAENKLQMWVPEGFAHGFYVLSESAEFVYKCTDYYNPDSERSLRWNDSRLKIDWPLIGGEPPSLSAKDQQADPWEKAEFFA